MFDSWSHSICWTVIATVLTLSAHRLLAQDAASDPPAKGRFAQQVRERRRDARDIRQGVEEFMAEKAYLGDFAREDWPKLKEAAEVQALLCEKAADAFEREDEKSAERLKKEIEKAGEAVETWRYRVGEIRKRQAEATPYEAGSIGDFQWMRRGTLDQYWALVRARRATAEAWRDLAEATEPGVDPARLNDLWDKGYAADVHREIAEWRYNFAQRRSEIWSDSRVSSEELTAKFQAYEQALEERVKLRLGDIERDRRMRELDRQSRSADGECQRAFDRAREARERASRAR